VLIRFDIGLERRLEVWCLLEVEEYLAVDEAVAVVVFVEVPRRDVARVSVLVLGRSPRLA